MLLRMYQFFQELICNKPNIDLCVIQCKILTGQLSWNPLPASRHQNWQFCSATVSSVLRSVQPLVVHHTSILREMVIAVCLQTGRTTALQQAMYPSKQSWLLQSFWSLDQCIHWPQLMQYRNRIRLTTRSVTATFSTTMMVAEFAPKVSRACTLRVIFSSCRCVFTQPVTRWPEFLKSPARCLATTLEKPHALDARHYARQ